MDQHTDRLVEEIWTSWRRRDFAAMHKARVQLAGNGRGPNQRLLFAPLHQQPSLDDWRTALALPGQEGGLSASQVEPYEPARAHGQQLIENDDQPLPDTANLRQDVQNDLRRIKRYLIQAQKRRAFPRWGAPTEAWTVALAPQHHAKA